MSSQWHGGKGSDSRISDLNAYRDGYDKIFKKMKREPEYKFRSNLVILQGDTHSTSVSYQNIYNLPNGCDTVHVGDVGLGFGKLPFSKKTAMDFLDRYNRLCSERDINCYLIRGNHDATYSDIWDSKWSNVFMVGDHAYAKFPNGKTVIMVAGGVSVDRCVRTDGIDYWSGEITNDIENVAECDISFSHDCPEKFNHKTSTLHERFQWYIDRDPTLLADCAKQREMMTGILGRAKVKNMCYGHYHNHMVEEHDGVYGRCLNINELFEFDANKTYTL